MALKLPFTTDQGFDAPNAYVQISGITFALNEEDGKWFAIVELMMHFDEQARRDGKRSLGQASMDRKKFEIGPGTTNPMLAQLYTMLKGLPEFSNAVDADDVPRGPPGE